MIRGLVGTLEKHHGVRILHEAVLDAVRLSNRYISGRQLPDKAVSVLDTTCARIGISQTGTPPPVEEPITSDKLKDFVLGQYSLIMEKFSLMVSQKKYAIFISNKATKRSKHKLEIGQGICLAQMNLN